MLLLRLNINGQVLEMQQKFFTMYHNIRDMTKKQQYLSINVEYGEILVSYFVKLVCVLVVCVVRLITSYCIWLKTASRKYFKPVNALHCLCTTRNKALGCSLSPTPTCFIFRNALVALSLLLRLIQKRCTVVKEMGYISNILILAEYQHLTLIFTTSGSIIFNTYQQFPYYMVELNPQKSLIMHGYNYIRS